MCVCTPLFFCFLGSPVNLDLHKSRLEGERGDFPDGVLGGVVVSSSFLFEC